MLLREIWRILKTMTFFKKKVEEDLVVVSKDELISIVSEGLAEKALKVNKPVVKSLSNDEKRLFTAVVLRPNVVDSQGDLYDEDVVEKACHAFNTECQQGNLQHMLNTDSVKFVESYIAPFDYTLGAGEVLKGDWVATAYIADDDIWKMCKEGTFTGFSVGCSAEVEILDE